MKKKEDKNKDLASLQKDLANLKNLFVTDGACFVTQGCYEPTLTIMAV